MQIKVDSRGVGEEDIFQKLLGLNDVKKYTIEKAVLDVGDYHIFTTSGELAVVVERKSHGDLAGSICTNNHIKEQMHRMKALKAQNPNVVLFLLYEGVLDAKWVHGKNGGLPNTSACMFLTTSTSREGIHVHYTASREHSAKWIFALANKEMKGELRPAPSDGTHGAVEASGSGDYLQTLALTKQGNRKFENQWVRMLMSIDSISLDRARAIADMYPTCASLVRKVIDDDGNAEKDLADIQVKKRKLGPAISKTLCALFKK